MYGLKKISSPKVKKITVKMPHVKKVGVPKHGAKMHVSSLSFGGSGGHRK